MSEDNDYSLSDSNEYFIGKKKSIKKVTKLGKRIFNKSKSFQVKSQCKYFFKLLLLDKYKRENIFDKPSNYSKLAKDKFLYLPYHPLSDLSDYIGEIIEVKAIYLFKLICY